MLGGCGWLCVCVYVVVFDVWCFETRELWVIYLFIYLFIYYCVCVCYEMTRTPPSSTCVCVYVCVCVCVCVWGEERGGRGAQQGGGRDLESTKRSKRWCESQPNRHSFFIFGEFTHVREHPPVSPPTWASLVVCVCIDVMVVFVCFWLFLCVFVCDWWWWLVMIGDDWWWCNNNNNSNVYHIYIYH